MKKRYIVLGALVLGLALIALGLGAARRSVVGDDRRDFAAETFRGASETRYVQLSLYPKEEKHLTADGMMAVKNALEASLTADSISPDGGYLLVGSGETAVTLSRESAMADGMTSINTTDATATVYFGNWFGLHPTVPLTGGFVDGGETGQGYCAIDEYTAARLFGSVDVCGLDITVNGFMYTVTAVVPADRGTYSGYYGYTPRVWLLYNSPAMLSERLTFTSLEAVLPSMTTGRARSIFLDATGSYYDDESEVVENTDRYTPSRLYQKVKTLTKMAVAEGDTYPYYENISRIRETKCAMILVFEAVCYVGAVILLCVLLYIWLHPLIKRHKEHRAAKKLHAIV